LAFANEAAMKVVVNRAVGSCFSVSSAGLTRLFELKGAIGPIGDDGKPPVKSNWLYSLPRNDKDLVQVVEELGSAASDQNAEIIIIEIPDDANWSISDIVGYEYIKVDGQIL
jgi:hypothetical protein